MLRRLHAVSITFVSNPARRVTSEMPVRNRSFPWHQFFSREAEVFIASLQWNRCAASWLIPLPFHFRKTEEMSSVKLPKFHNPTPAEMRALEIAARRERSVEIHRLLNKLVSAFKAVLRLGSRKEMRHA
jgi:hypothetical protein